MRLDRMGMFENENSHTHPSDCPPEENIAKGNVTNMNAQSTKEEHVCPSGAQHAQKIQ